MRSSQFESTRTRDLPKLLPAVDTTRILCFFDLQHEHSDSFNANIPNGDHQKFLTAEEINFIVSRYGGQDGFKLLVRLQQEEIYLCVSYTIHMLQFINQLVLLQRCIDGVTYNHVVNQGVIRGENGKGLLDPSYSCWAAWVAFSKSHANGKKRSNPLVNELNAWVPFVASPPSLPHYWPSYFLSRFTASRARTDPDNLPLCTSRTSAAISGTSPWQTLTFGVTSARRRTGLKWLS